MPKAILNINGQILGSDAKISVFDRSYLYGDSLYEVVRTYRGKFFLFDEHLERLQKSAQLARMTLGQSLATIRQEITRTVEAFFSQQGGKNKDAYVRLVISRGRGKIGFSEKNVETSTLYTIIVQPFQGENDLVYEKGISLQVSQRLRNDARALDPAMKSGNYLNSLLAYLEAEEAGFSDALLCNSDGHITEGTTFNVFYVKRNILVTPPIDIGILEGVTRRKVLEIAKGLGLLIRECRFPKERLYEAEEVFITSSTREVLPVTSIDKIKISKSAGPITKNLLKVYRMATTQEST